MTQRPDRNYVTASAPVNRRTAGAQAPAAQPVNPVVQERLAATRARTRLGPALVEQVRTGPAKAQHTPLRAITVVGAVVAAASGVALFLAWLQASVPMGAAGAAGLLAGLVMAQRGMRAHPGAVGQAAPAMPLFDEACLQALDRALTQLAPEVPEGVATQLTTLKQVIVRIARQGGAVTADENFTVDDRLYLGECVRRYLPDTLQSYLAVPRTQRDAPMLDGRSAAQLLASQLDLLLTEMQKREAAMARSAADQLVRQQRFLQSKAGR